MSTPDFDNRIAAVRAFTRFYTQKSGVLNERLHDSSFGLTEARILYELANRDNSSAKDLSFDLDLDAGYVSRVLKKFEKHDLISREQSPHDRRRQTIALTAAGHRKFNVLNLRSAELYANLLSKLKFDEQFQLVTAMNTITTLLDDTQKTHAPLVIRPHRPGDMGWIVQVHGRFYAEEFGWDETFEALVAEIVSTFLSNFDPDSDCCWIAEKDGCNVGSALVVRADETTAKLRLVLVEPVAWGHGIGIHLVKECIRFSKQAGYTRMTLWTQANLHAAVAIYKKLGFKLVKEEAHRSFGHDLLGQNWTLKLK